MQKVAFFDIDGTVFRSSLIIQLVEALIDRSVFPESARDVYAQAYERWRNREGTYEEYIGAVVAAYMNNIKGVYYGDLADIGREVVEKQSKHVYRYTRDLIRELHEARYFLVAISQSPKTILDEFCRAYGFDKVYGRIYELGPQDRFTGDMVDVHQIENKANIVKRVLGSGEFDKRDSVGVGDTNGDIPLLEEVDRAICFNPNKLLYEHAQRQGWEVVVERKDVIYKL